MSSTQADPGSARPQAVVIGAGNGLGRSLARRLAREGLVVTVVARDGGRLASLVEEIASDGGTARAVTADATDPAGVGDAVTAVRAHGPLVLLAYNAAGFGGPLSATGLDDLRAASDVNIHSPVLAVQAALPDLRAHDGAVLITGGGLALYPAGALGVLSVGKAAIRAAALCLADELTPTGVVVRTLTIAGTIEPGGDLDPDRLADTFWRLRTEAGAPVETVVP